MIPVNIQTTLLMIKLDSQRLQCPFCLDNELIAIIDAEHPDKNFFKQAQLDFLSQISSLISVTLKEKHCRTRKV